MMEEIANSVTPAPSPAPASQQTASLGDMCSVKLHFTYNEMENFRYLASIARHPHREIMAHFIRRGFADLYTEMTNHIAKQEVVTDVQQANGDQTEGETKKTDSVPQEPAADAQTTEAAERQGDAK